MLPLVSVLVPVYNVEIYLDRCLESIVSQDYTNIEIILLVQPSNDGSENRAKKWGTKDSRIRIYHQDVPDLAMARNNLVKYAKGEYCCFVDSDDLIDDKHIKLLMDAMRLTDADMVQCRVHSFKDDRAIPNDLEQIDCAKVYTGRDFTFRMLCGEYGAEGGVVQSKLQKKGLLDGVEFPNFRYSEDMATVYKYTMKAQKIAVVNAKTYYYQSQRGDSITHDKTKKMKLLIDGLLACKEQSEYFNKVDEQIYNQCLYTYINQLTKLRKELEKMDLDIEKTMPSSYLIWSDKVLIKDIHCDAINKLMHGKISMIKKFLCIIGLLSPQAWFVIWNSKRRIKLYFEWKNKK